ncbi:MAG: response regulator transcription factor [Flavobacteriales bacterium]|nr:response regulator transcription factor [Flavobacteriales bacterium]
MKILLADDHQLILDGLKTAVGSNFPEAEVVTAINGQQLYFELDKNDCDLLLLDIRFGTINAKEIIRDLKRDYPQTKILVLSTVSDKYSLQQIINMGVEGYVLKSESLVEILQGIKSISAGQTYFSREVSEKMEDKVEEREIVLTQREKEVLAEIIQEKPTKEIAETLCIAEKTVEMHRSNLFIKLDVKNVVGLVKKAILLGLVEN